MENQLIRDILVASREFRKITQHFLEIQASKWNITTTQLLVATVLKKNPTLTLNGLADSLNLSKSTTSGVVDRMVKGGYLSRKQDENNKRFVQVTLTPSGEFIANHVYNNYLDGLTPILNISKEELEQMLETQRKMITLLKERKKELDDI